MSASAYEMVAPARLDPIMALDQEFRLDPDPQKVNLVVGVYQDEKGQSPVLQAVKAAEKILLGAERSKAYLPIEGERSFIDAAETLIFGEGSDHDRASLHTPGGTGALRLAGDFLANHHGDKRVWISNPAYPNHEGIMSTLGLACETYRYFCLESGALLFDEMIDDLSRADAGDIVILHGCCHNPSGADMTADQWQQLAEFLDKAQLFPIVDLAYLGYARGLERDNEAIKTLFRTRAEGIVTTSFSKNFALYAERTGLITFVAAHADDARRCVAAARTYARKLYTSPPAHGSRIIATVLGNDELRALWMEEVNAMRQRLRSMRVLLSQELEASGINMRIFPGLGELNGMFSLTRITSDQVETLRQEHHIYMLPNGRISIAGIRPATIDHLVTSIRSAL